MAFLQESIQYQLKCLSQGPDVNFYASSKWSQGTSRWSIFLCFVSHTVLSILGEYRALSLRACPSFLSPSIAIVSSFVPLHIANFLPRHFLLYLQDNSDSHHVIVADNHNKWENGPGLGSQWEAVRETQTYFKKRNRERRARRRESHCMRWPLLYPLGIRSNLARQIVFLSPLSQRYCSKQFCICIYVRLRITFLVDPTLNQHLFTHTQTRLEF